MAPKMAERTGAALAGSPGLEGEPHPGHGRRWQPRRADGASDHRGSFRGLTAPLHPLGSHAQRQSHRQQRQDDDEGEESEAEHRPVPPEEIGVDGAHRPEGEERRHEERHHRREQRPADHGRHRAEGAVGRGGGGARTEGAQRLELERLDASLPSNDLTDDHESGQGGQRAEDGQRDRLRLDGLLRQPDRRRPGPYSPRGQQLAGQHLRQFGFDLSLVARGDPHRAVRVRGAAGVDTAGERRGGEDLGCARCVVVVVDHVLGEHHEHRRCAIGARADDRWVVGPRQQLCIRIERDRDGRADLDAELLFRLGVHHRLARIGRVGETARHQGHPVLREVLGLHRALEGGGLGAGADVSVGTEHLVDVGVEADHGLLALDVGQRGDLRWRPTAR